MMWSARAKQIAKLALPLAAGIVLLSSCLEVDEQITINSDGSGVMRLKYAVARVATHLERSNGSAVFAPLPADPETLAAAIRKTPGLRLESFSPTTSPESVGAAAVIDFQKVGQLDEVLGRDSAVTFTYSSSPQVATFRQTIYPGDPAGANQETLALVRKLFSAYRLTFSIRTPKPVQSTNEGTISNDKLSASYTTTIPDVIESKRPVVWEVSW